MKERVGRLIEFGQCRSLFDAIPLRYIAPMVLPTPPFASFPFALFASFASLR
jgi:hypothetical protein